MSFEYKYAPNSWKDLVFADDDVRDHLTHYAQGRSFDHILLHGPHGSGKSQTAKVLAATSYGKTLTEADLDVVEHVGDLKQAVKAWNSGGRFGYTMMSNDTLRPYAIVQELELHDSKIQIKLRALMDTMVNARFIFTTNRLENVDSGIRDRCDCFELEVPSAADFVSRAQVDCKAEGVEVVDADLQSVLAANGKSVRAYMRALEKTVVGVRTLREAA